jgi:hypothetical protein
VLNSQKTAAAAASAADADAAAFVSDVAALVSLVEALLSDVAAFVSLVAALLSDAAAAASLAAAAVSDRPAAVSDALAAVSLASAAVALAAAAAASAAAPLIAAVVGPTSKAVAPALNARTVLPVMAVGSVGSKDAGIAVRKLRRAVQRALLLLVDGRQPVERLLVAFRRERIVLDVIGFLRLRSRPVDYPFDRAGWGHCPLLRCRSRRNRRKQ